MLLSKRVIDPKFRTIRGTFDIPLSAMRAEVGFQKPVSNRHELNTVLPQMTLSQPPKLSMECRQSKVTLSQNSASMSPLPRAIPQYEVLAARSTCQKFYRPKTKNPLKRLSVSRGRTLLMQEHKFKGKQTLDIFDRTLPASLTGNKTQQSFLQN